MSKEFVEKRINSSHLHTACKQQKQISYFTKSSVQEEITEAYLDAWANRNYITNDYFLNFVKAVFRTQNFLEFFKYYRYPVSSARFVNNRIKGPLKRVFFAEDSYFKYSINNKVVACPDELNSEEFNETLFNAMLFRHNDIIITDLSDINTPYREIIDIDRVIAIDSRNSIINRIAFKAMMGGEMGYLYIDDRSYIFYPQNDRVEPVETPHDLGRCPADYISGEAFNDTETDVVRKSIFSYAREEFEEYVFLKTLQRMTEPNGAIPVVTMLTTNVVNETTEVKAQQGHPSIANETGSQMAHARKETIGSKNQLQTGTSIQVPKVMKDDGSVDMDVVSNYFNFHYMPTEALEYLNKRIKEIEQSIIATILGDFSESSEDAKNELQVSKGYVSKEDVLRELSIQLSRVRKRTDFNMLGLKYGPKSVEVDVFFGSDFFIGSESDVYALLEISPNPIESRSLLTKLARTKNRFNEDKFKRDQLLYQLLPYSTQKDFDAAVLAMKVGDTTFQYQTRFNYWIELFEAFYGDILFFWEGIEATNSAKLVLINNLIVNLITENYERPIPEPAAVV